MNVGSFLPSLSSMPDVVRDVVDKVTNAVMNYTDVEVKVLGATNDDNWGPHGKAMQDISSLTFSSSSFGEIMGVVWKRLSSTSTVTAHPRRVYKTLTLLLYLLKHGSPRVVTEVSDHLDSLRFIRSTYAADLNKHSPSFANVCTKVDQITQLLNDHDQLSEERARAQNLKHKYAAKKTKGRHQPATAAAAAAAATASNLSEFNFEGKWKSTTPGFLEKISDFTEKVKDFVFDVGGPMDNDDDDSGSDDDSDGDARAGNQREPVRKDRGANNKDDDDDDDDFSEFQQAADPGTDSSFIFEAKATPPQQKEEETLISIDDEKDFLDLFASVPAEANFSTTTTTTTNRPHAFAPPTAKTGKNSPDMENLFDPNPPVSSDPWSDFAFGDSKAATPPPTQIDLFENSASSNKQESDNLVDMDDIFGPLVSASDTPVTTAIAAPPPLSTTVQPRRKAATLAELERKISFDLANFTLEDAASQKAINSKSYRSMNAGGF